MTPNTQFDYSFLGDVDFSNQELITALRVDDHQALIKVNVRHLAQIVLDPEAAERGAEVGDPRMAGYQAIRKQVQRLLEGQKKKNATLYEEYIRRGVADEIDYVTPPITLFTPDKLEVIDGPMGTAFLLAPRGHWFAAIDGETQVIAWLRVFRALQDMSLIDKVNVPLVIHHGRSIDWARQAFHDLNLLGIRPNTAVGISMDRRDYGTRVTRRLMDESELLRDRVEERRRQLRKRDSALMTISGLRQGVVTTLFGSVGLEIGARQVPELPADKDPDALADDVVDIWLDILDALEDALVGPDGERRVESIASAPAVLAALGIVAHKVINEDLALDELTETLSQITWEREIADSDTRIHPWLGVAGKRTERGAFSVGGPKEYGRAIAEALENPHSKSGRQIRGLDLDAVTLAAPTADAA